MMYTIHEHARFEIGGDSAKHDCTSKVCAGVRLHQIPTRLERSGGGNNQLWIRIIMCVYLYARVLCVCNILQAVQILESS